MTQRNNPHPIVLHPTADAAGAAIMGSALESSTTRVTAIAIITTTGTGTSRPGCDRA